MELLVESLMRDNFGLRERFPWVGVGIRSKDYLHTCISRRERAYLSDLMRPVFDDTQSLKIERVENPYLWGRYILQYEEMKSASQSKHVNEQIMVHATAAPNAYRIADENFNWRLTTRARFGRGVSFSKDVHYAVRHATRTSTFIVAGILVANSSRGDWYQRIPPNGEDTTTGYSEDVCIKYSDNDFYPYYIVNRQIIGSENKDNNV